MNILSIQSWVAYGHVGNASAVFPLQRLGAEVWAINTVQFSNHTGYGAWTGQVFTGDAVAELVEASRSAACLAAATRCCRAIWAMRRSARRSSTRWRGCGGQPARALLLRSGDRRAGTGVYVRPGIAEFMRDRALPQPISPRPTSSSSDG